VIYPNPHAEPCDYVNSQGHACTQPGCFTLNLNVFERSNLFVCEGHAWQLLAELQTKLATRTAARAQTGAAV
jgi:hypothetical protein